MLKGKNTKVKYFSGFSSTRKRFGERARRFMKGVWG